MMKRRTALLLPLAAVGAMAGDNLLAATPSRTLLPIIAAEVQNVTTSLVTLVNADCGLVNAVVIPGTARVLVAYTARPSGVLHVTEDIGNRLVEVPNPDLALLLLAEAAPVAPSFTFPGPKQGSASMVIVGAELRIYATSREASDPTGPFKVVRLSMPVPSPAVAP